MKLWYRCECGWLYREDFLRQHGRRQWPDLCFGCDAKAKDILDRADLVTTGKGVRH